MAKEKTSGIYFKVTDEERALIEQKMALAGVRNMSAYIRKMCIDGYTINLQIPELTECAKFLRYTSNNVNQIARRVNSGGAALTKRTRSPQSWGRSKDCSGTFWNSYRKSINGLVVGEDFSLTTIFL